MIHSPFEMFKIIITFVALNNNCNLINRNNPKNVLKVPIGAYKQANMKGLLSDFLFYYQLKSINIQGHFKRGEVISAIQTKIDLSSSRIRAKISRLESLGWVKSSKGNKSLVKYDSLFNSLGIDLSKENGFRLIKISPDSFIDDLYIKEIKINLAKQKCIVRKLHNKRNNITDTEKTVNFDKLFLSQKRDIREGIISNVNYDVSLSCKAVADLFGYTSSVQGYYIEQRLKKNNLLHIERRILHIRSNVSLSYFNNLNLSSSYFYCNNNILKQLTNKLTVINY